MNPHEPTRAFEEKLERYTGAPHAIAVDSNANAMFLALHWEWQVLKRRGLCDSYGNPVAEIPRRTYMSVPCAIIHAGGRIRWVDHAMERNGLLIGAYDLKGTRCVDAALSFTAGMYHEHLGKFVCLSFTGPFKRLKLGKGGAILTDDDAAAAWFRRARFNGRNNISYHEDTFDMIGWNFYMAPQIAVMGLHMMDGLLDVHGPGDHQEFSDLALPYPDLSTHPAYKPHTVA